MKRTFLNGKLWSQDPKEPASRAGCSPQNWPFLRTIRLHRQRCSSPARCTTRTFILMDAYAYPYCTHQVRGIVRSVSFFYNYIILLLYAMGIVSAGRQPFATRYFLLCVGVWHIISGEKPALYIRRWTSYNHTVCLDIGVSVRTSSALCSHSLAVSRNHSDEATYLSNHWRYSWCICVARSKTYQHSRTG